VPYDALQKTGGLSGDEENLTENRSQTSLNLSDLVSVLNPLQYHQDRAEKDCHDVEVWDWVVVVEHDQYFHLDALE
jgi:hypothetical protein